MKYKLLLSSFKFPWQHSKHQLEKTVRHVRKPQKRISSGPLQRFFQSILKLKSDLSGYIYINVFFLTFSLSFVSSECYSKVSSVLLWFKLQLCLHSNFLSARCDSAVKLEATMDVEQTFSAILSKYKQLEQENDQLKRERARMQSLIIEPNEELPGTARASLCHQMAVRL